MKKQFLLLALLATTAITHPDYCSDEEINQTKKNILEENIYKASFLLGMASIASAISKGDHTITRNLGYAAASGFFVAPLANACKSKKISNQAMLALSGLITGAAFINTPNNFEYKQKRELLASITTTFAGLCNIRSGRKFIYNTFFSAISCVGGYRAYAAAHEILYPEPHNFEPLKGLSEELPSADKDSLTIETVPSDHMLPLKGDHMIKSQELPKQD